jgi:hypothetical protein
MVNRRSGTATSTIIGDIRASITELVALYLPITTPGHARAPALAAAGFNDGT